MNAEFSARFEKIDSRFEKIDSRFENQDIRFTNIENDLQEIKKMQRKTDIKIEHKIEPQIQALFEAKDIIFEKLDGLGEKVDVAKTKNRKGLSA